MKLSIKMGLKRGELLLLLGLLIIPIAFSVDNSPQFLNEFSPTKHVYDYVGVFSSPEEVEAELDNLAESNTLIYVVTLSSGSDLELVKKRFDFEYTQPISPEEIPTEVTPYTPAPPLPVAPEPEPPVEPSEPEPLPEPGEQPQPPLNGYGTILSYEDVVAYGDGPPRNTFRYTGYEPCWPLPAPEEPDWLAIWGSHSCMGSPPAGFETIRVPFSWLGENREGYYEVSIATNAKLGEVYKDESKGVWMLKDRDGYTYVLAPLDPHHPVYDWLYKHYDDPEYVTESVRVITLTQIISEKYGRMVRLKGGTRGYPIPECETPRRKAPPPIVVDEGSSVTLTLPKTTGQAIMDTGCRVVIIYRADNTLVIGKRGCGFSTIALIESSRAAELIENNNAEAAILALVNQIKTTTTEQPPSQGLCLALFESASNQMSQAEMELAYQSFQEVVESCEGELRIRAMYQQAYIRYTQQRYREAGAIAEQVFAEAVQGDNEGLTDLAREGLKLGIMAYRDAGDCSSVNRLKQLWTEHGFGEDTEVALSFEVCRPDTPQPQPPQQPQPPESPPQIPETPSQPPPEGTEEFKADLLLSYNTKLRQYQEGKYHWCLVGIVDDYIASRTIDTELAKGFLELIIRCNLGEENCNPANDFYSIYQEEYGENPELSSMLQSCRSTPEEEPGYDPFEQWFPGYRKPTGTKRQVIQGLLEIGWDLYAKGDFKSSERMALYVWSHYFREPEHQINKVEFPEFYKSTEKLKFVSMFDGLSNGIDFYGYETCNQIGDMYMLTYFDAFGVDEDIEAAWNRCEGKYHFQSTGELCSTDWPTGEGPKVKMNTILDGCELFETGSAEMDYVIRDARRCCNGQENSELCEFARSHSTLSDPEQNLKRCMGIYIIKAVGEYAKYIKGYFEPECNCADGTIPSKQDNPYAGQCNSDNFYEFNQNARSLPCRETKEIVWESDTDMSQNNCNIVEPPAHATLNILQTGTCADYSVLVTTLLRKAGYKPNEVFSVDQTIHATNLVKLPGDSKYHHVDTTGNKVGIVFDGWFPGRDYNKIGRWGCYNDKGHFRCPDNSMIYENFGVPGWGVSP